MNEQLVKDVVIVAFMGKAGSGKSTAAKYLVDAFGYKKLSFADGLKKMLHKGLGIHEDYIYGNKKQEPCEALCGRTGRHAMITLGTEWGRNLIGSDIWVKALENELINQIGLGVCRFAIDDVRFLNEAKCLRDLKNNLGVRTTLAKIDRVSEISSIDHSSETEMDSIEWDWLITNDSTLDSLHISIHEMLKMNKYD